MRTGDRNHDEYTGKHRREDKKDERACGSSESGGTCVLSGSAGDHEQLRV